MRELADANRANEQTLYVQEHGSGSAVVLLHGTPSFAEDFAPIVEALATRHRVLIPHLPGYGRSLPPRGPYSLADVLARLESGLASRGVSQAALVGFSGGAYKAVAMALAGRIRVSRLALLAPVVGFGEEIAAAMRDLAAAVRLGAFDPRPTWLERMGSPGLAERNPCAAARLQAWLEAAPLSLQCDELNAAANAPDLRPRLRELACPVLVCVGSADRALPPGAAQEVAASVPGSELRVFAGLGHGLLIEAPELVTRAVAEFLDRDRASD